MKVIETLYRSAVPVLAALLMLGAPDAARAQQQQNGDLGRAIVNGIFGLIGHAAAVSHARKGWAAIDAETQGCFAAKTNAQPSDLVKQGIGPDDARVTPYLLACQREAEAGKARLAQLMAQQAEQEEAARRAHQAALAQAAQQKAQQAARHRDLVAKFGDQMAATIESGKLRLGMTKDQVLAMKGTPPRKDTVPPDYDVWHYSDGDVAFTKGRVSYAGQ